MKNFSKILVTAFTMMMVFSILYVGNVNATGPSDQTVEVSGDSLQTQLQSHVRTTFRFRERTHVTVDANVEIYLNLELDTTRIDHKDFVLEIEGEHNLQMNMICTRDETQLGLMEGPTYRIRNRNTYRYREGFCISIECEAPCDCKCKCENECQCECICECQCLDECDCECNCECQCLNECHCLCNCEDKDTFIKARLRIRATNENRIGTWAYYDETNKEWDVVPTTVEDGYLTAETDHFSTWTVLIPTSSPTIDMGLIIGSICTIGIIGIIVGTSVFFFKKRRYE
jgi:hypothetical protein